MFPALVAVVSRAPFSRTARLRPLARHRPSLSSVVALASFLGSIGLPAYATDVVIQPSSGSGFVVKDASGTTERLRVQESGAVSLPALPAAPAQLQGLCMSAGGQLGPCSGGTGGGSYAPGTGLTLSGTTFSVAPSFRLPQACAANQIAQWNGTAWTCGSAAGANLPPGTANQTLRYDASNKLVANDRLQAFDDGALVANGTIGTGDAHGVQGTAMLWYPGKAAFRAGYANAGEWTNFNVGDYSAAMGRSTWASGGSSTALGAYTYATGSAATALGYQTQARGSASTAMGASTIASGADSTAMGATTTAAGDYSVAMGVNSTASATASIAMGEGVIARGVHSIAMGKNVDTGVENGSFIIGDDSARPVIKAAGNNMFTAVFYGGAQFVTANPSDTVAYGVSLAPGGASWTALSDRNAKTAVRRVDPREVLEKIIALPLNTWQYKSQEAKYRHMGPMAQDFYAAFHLGETDRGIDTIDADGVALAAIQGLNSLIAEKDAKAAARLDEKDREIAALKARIASLETLAGDLADVKSQLASLRRSEPTVVAAALHQP